MKKSYTVGIDVGGTNIKIGLVSASGKVIARDHLPTGQFGSQKKKMIKALVSTIFDLLKQYRITNQDVAGIGCGLPGLINPQSGVVNFLPNIPGWKNVPLKQLMEDELGIPVYIENDVNLITLGEWQHGAGQGVANLICITLGTGVGGGLILNNAIYRGENFVAGEIGHVPLNEKGPDCNCGSEACFERYVGNQQLKAKAIKLFSKKDIQLEDVFAMAQKGNLKAIRFWEQAGGYIGLGLVGVINVLNPKLIIIGGGVANNWKFMAPMIKKTIQSRCMRVQSESVKIVRAKLGDDAGIIGSQALIGFNQGI